MTGCHAIIFTGFRAPRLARHTPILRHAAFHYFADTPLADAYAAAMILPPFSAFDCLAPPPACRRHAISFFTLRRFTPRRHYLMLPFRLRHY
jgi:hypothetical protein